MITKMHLVNITGPRDDIDRMADQYLRHYDVHLINASKELAEIKTLKQYTSPNPYEPWLERVNELLEFAPEEMDQQEVSDDIELKEAQELIEKIERDFAPERGELKDLRQKRDDAYANYQLYEPFASINHPMEDLLGMDHLKIRFGRFTPNNYRKFVKYINEMVPSFFIKSKETEDYVYGMYFTTHEARQRVDALYYSLAFERLRLPENHGTFKDITQTYLAAYKESKYEIEETQTNLEKLIAPYQEKLLQARLRFEALSEAYEVRKYAAITRDEFAQKETRYLLLAWMPQDQAKALAEELKQERTIAMFIEDETDSSDMNPPTKMKNNFFVKPFELITRMYGIPNYHELDPTGLVALTYSLLFGAMFGDVGHGIFLFLIGCLGFVKKKWNLLKLFVPIGISSTIFGFLYGAIFGFEDVLEPLWLNPTAALSTVPFFGQLNTIFLTTVVFGMFIILVTMLMNIGLRLKQGETWSMILDRNGLAGFLFYGLLVVLIILYMTGHTIPFLGIIGTILGLLLLCIAFKEQIMTHLIDKKSGKENQDGLAITLLATFFETFETILTYFSNTISFVRVGAFAVSHGAMMSVVLMFAHAEGNSLANINWLVFILGNLFVVGFEGLIVFIQVLRLEFYEIFSHFYQGDGIEFKSIWQLVNNK